MVSATVNRFARKNSPKTLKTFGEIKKNRCNFCGGRVAIVFIDRSKPLELVKLRCRDCELEWSEIIA